MKKLSILLLLLSLVSCFKRGPDPNEVPVAKVYDNYLYLSDLKGIVRPGIASEDSVQIIRNHIKRWINDQLLLHQAEQNLSNYEKELERKLNDYRTTLLIHKYKQSYIEQNLDTLVQEKEIQQYYHNYSSNFLLNKDMIKGLFIILPRSSPESWKPRRWYKSDSSDDFLELEKYCAENGIEMNYFEEEWIPLDNILDAMPRIYITPKQLLQRNYYEAMDSTNHYWLKISDSRAEGTASPLDIIRDDIRSILLNKKKFELIRELELNIFNDASNRGHITEYK
ncbi:MAG: hypothetical protein JW801_18430 [Bacteroidales bacterium]|nr:hypothetical protein [Bacteroidales bacterium]